MTFPAFFDFARDVAMLRHPATLAVYGHIITLPGAFHDPQELKAWYLANLVQFEQDVIIKAAGRLVARGYLVRHESDGEARYTVALCIPGGTPLPPSVPQETDPEILERRRTQQKIEGNARRARIKNAGGRYTIRDIRAQYDQQDGKCFYCATPLGQSYHLEHKTPLARGGTNGPENTCLSCAKCNLRKSTKTADEFIAVMGGSK